jgi:hypothetical protein
MVYRGLAGDEGVLGAETVFESVLGRTLFAFLGAGTGGMFCILFIGAMLRFR